MWRRWRAGVALRRKERPQPSMPGIADGRSTAGASSRPSQRSSLSAIPGSFQGSTRLLWIIAPLA